MSGLNANGVHTWTEANIDTLKRMWADGFSASQIGKAIGVSRNSAIGRIHRMGLSARLTTPKCTPYSKMTRPPRKSGMSRGAQDRRNAKRRAERAAAAAMRPQKWTPCQVGLPEPVPLNLTTLELTDRTCKYPVGEAVRREQRYCGCAIRSGERWLPFCGFHYAKSTNPVRPSRART